MEDEKREINPYAPPADEPRGATTSSRPLRGGGDTTFVHEHRPMWLVLLFGVLSLQLYGLVWLVRRRAFLDSLPVTPKLGPLPLVTCGVVAAQLVAAFAQQQTLSSVIGTGVFIVGGITCVRVQTILEAEFARTGRAITVSPVLSIFFGAYYLQYKINQAAKTPPVRRRRKKKKKAAPADTESAASAEPAEAAEAAEARAPTAPAA